MFGKFANFAKSLAEGVDVSETFNTTKNFLVAGSDATRKTVLENYEAGKEKASEYFEKHWPLMEKIVVGGLLSLAEEALNDEKNLAMVFEKSYELLPTGIRLVLSREKFVELSMKKREPIILSLQSYKLRKKSEDTPDSLDADHLLLETGNKLL